MAVFELEPVAPADGEAVLPLTLAKAQVRLFAEDEDEDDLIALFRDAAIALVEAFTMTRMQPQGLTWRGSFPPRDQPLTLGTGPVRSITQIRYTDRTGTARTLPPEAVRIGTHRRLLPAPGTQWPADADCGDGSVEIAFEAGFEIAAIPRPLLQAAQFMIGHFYRNREQAVTGTITATMPFAFTALCQPWRDAVL